MRERQLGRRAVAALKDLLRDGAVDLLDQLTHFIASDRLQHCQRESAAEDRRAGQDMASARAQRRKTTVHQLERGLGHHEPAPRQPRRIPQLTRQLHHVEGIPSTDCVDVMRDLRRDVSERGHEIGGHLCFVERFDRNRRAMARAQDALEDRLRREVVMSLHGREQQDAVACKRGQQLVKELEGAIVCPVEVVDDE